MAGLVVGACPLKAFDDESVRAAEQAAPDGAPRLILLLVVDQFGTDELERLEPLFTGGLRNLLNRGVSFSQAYHAHAITETAPGHATIATGCFPRHHGIVSNWWIDEGSVESRWAIDDDLYDESPLELERATLGEWLKSLSPASKVFAAAGKDRSAILLGGRQVDGTFWFDDEIGGYVTSDYYDEPGWLEEFDDRKLLDLRFGQVWEPLPLESETVEKLDLETLDFGPLHKELPITFGPPRPAPDESFYHAVRDSPWWDRNLAQFGRFLIEAEDLGGDDVPDLLALGFSAPDYVGHDHGPHSREYVDTLLRLDQTLSELLEYLDERVGLENMIVALTADHGVVPVPEIRQRKGLSGARVGSETIHCLQNVGRRLAEKHGVDRWLVPGPRLVPDLVERTGRSRAELEEETAQSLEQCPAVEAVWTSTELAGEVDELDPFRWLYANSFYPERSADFLIQFEEYFMASVASVTTHGSPYAYDTRVPMIVMAPGLAPEALEVTARTVDLAPTLAHLAGIPIPEGVDGSPLIGRASP